MKKKDERVVKEKQEKKNIYYNGKNIDDWDGKDIAKIMYSLFSIF